MSLTVRLAVIGLAVAFYFAPFPTQWVERYYSEGFYQILQRTITPISNRVPFALFDVITLGVFAALISYWSIGLQRARSGQRLRTVPRLALNTLLFGAAGSLLFDLAFAFNYGRTPLAQKLDYDRSRVTRQSAERLAALGVSNLNSLVKQVHAAPWPSKKEWVERITPSFQSVVMALGDSRVIATCQPKVSIFNFYLGAASFSGFTNPFGLEVILDSQLLPQEMPFTLAHEWGHLAGFADESEANFIALLTCLRSDDPTVSYSGWLVLYESLRPLVPLNTGSGTQTPDVDPQVIADLTAIHNRQGKSVKPWVSAPAYRVYDRYLKANRVDAGIGSYGLFIPLVLGTKFGENWWPELKVH